MTWHSFSTNRSVGTRDCWVPSPSIPDHIPPAGALWDPHSVLTWTSYTAPPGWGLEGSCMGLVSISKHADATI